MAFLSMKIVLNCFLCAYFLHLFFFIEELSQLEIAVNCDSKSPGL